MVGHSDQLLLATEIDVYLDLGIFFPADIGQWTSRKLNI